ncbi:Long-chain-alcohol oxidase FAO1 [Cardamine amara subsp. amara]|uniref:Long-chain-alcohol oxidase FAO1 n=1 Tax=Cardamine amara subsp. amara TaxID=228776 RepID=A0ABD0ZET1_CARAN
MENKERALDEGIIETAKVDEMTIKQRLINKAANLAKSGLRVVVLEKGNYFVARDYSALEGPSMFELFEAHNLLMTHDGRFRFMAGSAVGGGSVVNWSASLKTPDAIIEEWSVQRGISIFSSEKYKAAMDRVSKRIVPRNSSDEHYCGSCSFGCPTGEKRGTDSTWLVDAVNNNAVILTQCNAEKLILADNNAHKRRIRCLGVTASLSNQTRKKLQINAKVTVVACGSLKTPSLLASSGLKNPNIGRGLHIHPILMAWGYFPDKNSDFEGVAHEGEIVTSLHYVNEMDSTTPNITLETPAIGPGTYAALIPWVSGLTKADEENLITGLKQAVRILVAAGAAEVGTYRSDGQRLKCDGKKKEDLEAFLQTVEAPPGFVSMSKYWTHSFTAHQMGCCRMGATEKDGAIDGYGESWEAKDLYVCDASVLPTALGVNPMITIQSTAYCISNKIAELMEKKMKKD